MSPFEPGPGFVFIVLAFLGCGTAVAMKALNAVFGAGHRKTDVKRLEAELAAIRQEMAALRTWANDLILSFDSTLHQQEARLQSVERRALGPAGNPTQTRRPEPETEALESRTRV
jgi:hypothetical protein